MQIAPRALVGLLAFLVTQHGAVNAAPSEVGETVKGDLLAEEKFQLTTSSLSELDKADSKHASLFFPDDKLDKRSAKALVSKKCKTFPGDKLWPSEPVWKLLDLITGGALIKTVPIGAACYDDYGVYNEARCNHVADQWTNSSLQ
jgi:hypothetical protein